MGKIQNINFKFLILFNRIIFHRFLLCACFLHFKKEWPKLQAVFILTVQLDFEQKRTEGGKSADCFFWVLRRRAAATQEQSLFHPSENRTDQKCLKLLITVLVISYFSFSVIFPVRSCSRFVFLNECFLVLLHSIHHHSRIPVILPKKEYEVS